MLYISAVLALFIGCTPEGDVDPDTDTDFDTDTGGQTQDPITITGAWADNWGGYHTIDSTVWAWDENRYLISSYDNIEQRIFAQNDIGNSFFGGLWSRFDWTQIEDTYWYCHSTFDAESEAEARERTAPDASDPQESGCGGFAWSRLIAPLNIRGTYTDEAGTVHAIREGRWSMNDGEHLFLVKTFDNETQTLIAQNGATNTDNADLWSRFDWVFVNERLFVCHTANREDSAEKASMVPRAYDTNPTQSGCLGGPWVELTEAE